MEPQEWGCKEKRVPLDPLWLDRAKTQCVHWKRGVFPLTRLEKHKAVSKSFVEKSDGRKRDVRIRKRSPVANYRPRLTSSGSLTQACESRSSIVLASNDGKLWCSSSCHSQTRQEIDERILHDHGVGRRLQDNPSRILRERRLAEARWRAHSPNELRECTTHTTAWHLRALLHLEPSQLINKRMFLQSTYSGSHTKH